MKTHKHRSLAAVIFISCCAFWLTTIGVPSAEAIQVAPESIPDSKSPSGLLLQLEKAGTAKQRLALAKELRELGPSAIPALQTYLKRKRKSSEATRRKILAATGAAVPDKTGRFKIPKRQTKTTEKKNDEFDWLVALSKLSRRNGLGEVVADVAIIRALASWPDPKSGHVIVDFAFSEIGLIYRDECGRYLRKMSPYSLPALIHGSQNRKNSSMKRYTNYQLERLDRQNAQKAISAATTENLKIAIIKAFADSQYREAVFAVLDNTDHAAPRVRKAARAAWQEFATGREPPKPPERKLSLPNGKLSPDKEPLWLDHRVLADTAIRARIKELTGKAPNKNADLRVLTETLFSYYDQKRADATKLDFDAALAMVDAGKPDQAITVFDRILAVNPDFRQRDKMLAGYLAVAEKLEAAKQWQEAGVAYGKASAVAPDDQQANSALKKHHLMRAKAAGGGKEAEAARALAAEVDTSASGSDGSDSSGSSKQSKVLLFAGLAALAFAIIFLILGLSRRRQES